MKLRVIEDWQATYADPIRLAAGDMLYLTGHEDNWDGHTWLWARSSDGSEGWIPDNLICEAEGGHVAREDSEGMGLKSNLLYPLSHCFN